MFGRQKKKDRLRRLESSLSGSEVCENDVQNAKKILKKIDRNAEVISACYENKYISLIFKKESGDFLMTLIRGDKYDYAISSELYNGKLVDNKFTVEDFVDQVNLFLNFYN